MFHAAVQEEECILFYEIEGTGDEGLMQCATATTLSTVLHLSTCSWRIRLLFRYRCVCLYSTLPGCRNMDQPVGQEEPGSC